MNVRDEYLMKLGSARSYNSRVLRMNLSVSPRFTLRHFMQLGSGASAIALRIIGPDQLRVPAWHHPEVCLCQPPITYAFVYS